MCHLLREQQAGAAESSIAGPPAGAPRLRPRWAGAVAATLVGGLAVAALVAPGTTSPLSSITANPAAVAATRVALPLAPVVERVPASTLDDGVPGASDERKAGLGACDHGL